MRNQIKFVSCNDLEIMLSVDGQVVDKHAYYYPALVLICVKKGTLHLEIGKDKWQIEQGDFVLIDKNHHGFMEKSWTQEEGEAKMVAFILRPTFIQKVLKNIPITSNDDLKNTNQPVFIIPPNVILKGFFNSISTYLNEDEVDTELVELKTFEALLGILKFHPECFNFFQIEDKPTKYDLQLLMENNYMVNLPLSKLAELSGRSLSTFNRDFKSIFNNTPRRWLLRRRLIRAKEILSTTDRKPNNIYMELGFESLAHFSRTFKKEFEITLTDFRKNKHHSISSKQTQPRK